MARSWCIGLLGAGALLGCGGADHYDAPPGSQADGEAPASDRARAGLLANAAERELARAGEGRLEIATRSSVTSFLGSTRCVVEDAGGQVVAGADEESSEASTGEASQLSLVLPAGEAYTVRLTATTHDTRPTTCRATIGPVPIEAGAVARVRVFAWDCGDRIGYVPQAAHDDCYWLADWSFVARTSAALGGAVDAGVVPSDATARLTYHWSTSAPELGSFSEPAAPQTALRCLAVGEKLPFQVSISDGVCEQRVTQAVSCRQQ